MRFQMLFLLGSFFIFNCAMGMELVEVEVKTDKSNRIRSLDAAQALVSTHPSEKWKNYTLSSRVIAQAIKQEELNSFFLPEKEEITIIKELKKTDSNAYEQLVQEFYGLLKSRKGSRLTGLQSLRASIFCDDQKNAENKGKKLEHLEKEIKYFSQACKEEGMYFYAQRALALVISFSGIPLALTGIISNHCW